MRRFSFFKPAQFDVLSPRPYWSSSDISHRALLNIMAQTGVRKKQKNDGVCFGVASIGARALLLNRLDYFDRICAYWDKQHGRANPRYGSASLNLLNDIARCQIVPVPSVSIPQDADRNLRFFPDFPPNKKKRVEASCVLRTTGVYHQSELIRYFQLLDHVVKSSDRNLAAIVYNDDHVVTVGYDALRRKQWCYLDVSDLPVKWISDVFDLADRVSFHLADRKNIIIGADFYALHHDAKHFIDAFRKMQRNKTWQQIHRVTGKKVAARNVNDDSWLQLAAELNDCDSAKKLLEKGADPNALTRFGTQLPLHRAVYFAHPDMVELLAKAGARWDKKDGSQLTAWDYLRILTDREKVIEAMVDFQI